VSVVCVKLRGYLRVAKEWHYGGLGSSSVANDVVEMVGRTNNLLVCRCLSARKCQASCSIVACCLHEAGYMQIRDRETCWTKLSHAFCRMVRLASCHSKGCIKTPQESALAARTVTSALASTSAPAVSPGPSLTAMRLRLVSRLLASVQDCLASR
jgi:hypothetical protein